ncbi:hypothetical protein [Mesorhizobium huakuii]|uniref:TonB C-terminal domain-containing protein n=1 Tax=Mesorhizobium huakuii TaxID=28104 RepID=A0ABZ0VI46_9HYPH|nr:hypothetical protein [Mesorhizobium huakuii]WQB96326.1 hypothetical protein U0R22_000378 [Mesorhizobium huakuii]
MRTAVALALLASVSPAQADEAQQLETKIANCLRIPVDVEGPTFRVIFEITLDKTTRAQKVEVVEYEPQSDVAAKAAANLAMQVKNRCWPLGVKKSPIRLTFSIDLPS